MAYRAGTVALIGRPNVGKSTLVNRIVGHKVSIVSNKPQTTRRRVLGIATTEDHQIAFVDSPGVHEPHTELGKVMVDQARRALEGIDMVLVVVDGAHHPGEGDQALARMLDAAPNPVPRLLCLNKMDLLKAEFVQRNVDAYVTLFRPEAYMLTTATRGDNVDRLVEMIVSHLPERAPIYPEDEFTDQSSRFLSSEYVREKILQATRQEVPHAVAVTVDEWDDEGSTVRIHATIFVEKASQRAILIGKGGQFIKRIGTEARKEIEALLGEPVFLELHVKVSPDWRMNPRVIRELEMEG